MRPLRAPACLALSLALLAACSGSSPASGDSSFRLTTEVSGLDQVTDLGFLPDGRMVIVEKDGTVWLRDGGVNSVAAQLPVDTGDEKGLLGVVVPPSFADDQRLVLYRSVADSAGGTTLDRHRVASFVLGGDGLLDLGSERVLASGLRGPSNHDGGGMALGPDGLLYVGVGDTGCNSGRPPEPPLAPSNYFGTCLTNGNGKILRVALDGAVPDGNPLVSVAEVTACGDACGAAPGALGPPRTDIWAWGFRNPWRLAFDPETGRLWVADVGEVSFEELSVAAAGRHHGWPWREGRHGWDAATCRQTLPDTGDCLDPVYECRHGPGAGGIDGGCEAITGGAFLAGPRWPAELRDRYVFGDSVTRDLWTLRLTADRLGVQPGSRGALAHAPGPPVSFRTGPDGDVFVAVLSGQVLRLSPAGAP